MTGEIHGPVGPDRVLVRWLPTEALTEADLSTFAAVLSPGERERAARFHFAEDRRDYLAAHALTRVGLARVTGWGVAPDALRFTEGPKGKPELLPPPGLEAPRFNLSHTRGMVAWVVTGAHDLGVDVEGLARATRVLDLADHVFSPVEATRVHRAAEADRPRVFMAHWTMKEAVIKALGEGLSRPLDSFVVEPGETPPRFLDGSGQGERWAVWRCAPGPGHLLALAARLRREGTPRLDAGPTTARILWAPSK